MRTERSTKTTNSRLKRWGNDKLHFLTIPWPESGCMCFLIWWVFLNKWGIELGSFTHGPAISWFTTWHWKSFATYHLGGSWAEPTPSSVQLIHTERCFHVFFHLSLSDKAAMSFFVIAELDRVRSNHIQEEGRCLRKKCHTVSCMCFLVFG